ncbi:hypothetical protein BGX27_006424 [Mortierella sp. AM989]|nr:hypothetical protein BGX27_006424 [Mortierella sp. AM989]
MDNPQAFKIWYSDGSPGGVIKINTSASSRASGACVLWSDILKEYKNATCIKYKGKVVDNYDQFILYQADTLDLMLGDVPQDNVIPQHSNVESLKLIFSTAASTTTTSSTPLRTAPPRPNRRHFSQESRQHPPSVRSNSPSRHRREAPERNRIEVQGSPVTSFAALRLNESPKVAIAAASVPSNPASMLSIITPESSAQKSVQMPSRPRRNLHSVPKAPTYITATQVSTNQAATQTDTTTHLTANHVVTHSATPAPPQEDLSSDAITTQKLIDTEGTLPAVRSLLIQVLDNQKNLEKSFESSHEATMKQSYELNEYTTPRTFIVLPEHVTTTRMEKITGKQLRLYFLCEFGIHLQEGGKQPQRKVHLARHLGYELNNPDNFITKFGPQILRMLRIMRSTLIGGGIASAPLIMSTDPTLTAIKTISHINQLINSSIEYLKRKGNHSKVREIGGDSPKTLSGDELRVLVGYLKDVDKDEIYGNLSRITTKDGSVKWVCQDCKNHKEHERSANKSMNGFVANKGSFSAKGVLDIAIADSKTAKEFYKELKKAHNISELHISMCWSVSEDDLMEFRDAITRENIVNLIFNGQDIKKPSRSKVNVLSRQPYDPIIQLMFNNRIDSMDLKKFDGFFKYVSKDILKQVPTLSRLSLETDVTSIWPSSKRNGKEVNTFSGILIDLSSCLSTFRKDLLPQLFTLEWQDQESVVVKITHGQQRIEIIEAEIKTLPEPKEPTSLTAFSPSVLVKPLSNLVLRHLKLSSIEVKYHEAGAVDELLKGIEQSRRSIFEKNERCYLTTLIFSTQFRESWSSNAVSAMGTSSINRFVYEETTNNCLDAGGNVIGPAGEYGWSNESQKATPRKSEEVKAQGISYPMGRQ